MPSIRFYLRKTAPNKQGECPISLIYVDDKREQYLSTGKSIHPSHWNPNSANTWVKPSYGTAQVSFNLFLKKLYSDADTIMNNFYIKNNKFPSGAEMKELFDAATGRSKSPDKSLFGLFDEFVRFQTSQRGINNVSHGTYKNYLKVKERLAKFSAHRGIKLDFNTITHSFYDDFTAYCTLQENSESTIGSYIKIIKTFFIWCRIRHNIEITALVMSTLKVRDVENFFVFLSIEEFMRWRDLDLSSDPILDKARDAAILQTCLGCRYSDLQITLKEHVSIEESGRHVFRITTKKTESRVEFPLSQTAVSILNKYRGIHPKDWIPVSTQQNKHVKTIAKLAGMFEQIPITKGTGNFRKEVIYQKWQLITTHSMRRTAINLMFLEGMRDIDICAITGQALRTIQRYKQPDKNELMKATYIWDRKPEGDRTGEFKYEPKSPRGEPRE